MHVVVTGSRGQVSRALQERGPRAGIRVTALGRPALDLTRADGLHAALAAVEPDIVVNAAAFTAVDRAEREPELAFATNATGAKTVAQAAKRLGVPLLHLSTDYVFDGNLGMPYRERDPISPLGVYGASKAAGEEAVAATTPDHAILRTAWVYAPFGHNFARTMLRLATTRDAVRVVADQHGAPTSAHDLADAVIAVARNLVHDRSNALRGVFHATSRGEASWADFAEAIFAASAARGGPSARVERIATADYPTSTRRPADSRLDCSRLAAVHGTALPLWRESVGPTVARLLEDPEIFS